MNLRAQERERVPRKIDSWVPVELSEVVRFRSGGTPDMSNQGNWGGDIPWLSAKDLKSFWLKDSQIKISQQGAKLGTRTVQPGTVLILVRGMTLLKDIPIGVAAKEVAFNQDVKALEPLDGVDGPFIALALLNQKQRLMGYVSHSGHGTGRLSTDVLESLPLLLPPLVEQRRIVATLTTWDQAIEQAQRLIAAKRRRKQALMQQLLTGKRRLPKFVGEPWREIRLGEIFRERCEADRGDLPLLSITADRGVIPRAELEKKDTSNEDKRLYKRIAMGDIGYNTMRMWQGVSALSGHEGIISPAYTVCIPGPEILGTYAAHLFKHLPVVHLFRRYSQGLVDDTLNLKFKHFAEIRIALPCPEEQRRIAEVLSACDEELRRLDAQLDALKRQKKGLMQQLLTGKVRVPMEEGT